MDKIRILIVDDHHVVRKGIITLFQEEDDINIVGEAANGLEAIEKVKMSYPDIVLLDIAMPKMSGIEAAEIISKNHPTVKTLMFSMHNNEEYILKSVEVGAWGYLLKDASKEEILTAIRKLASGEKYFTHSVTNIIIETLVNKKKGDIVKPNAFNISKKEKIILQHIIDGLNSREIAERLGLSVRTVDNHRLHLMKKINVKNSIEMVKVALRENLV
jgi:DNA-binding NarL/FixJ family response regulator